MEEYILEKKIWTQDDFDNMGWHDASIYGMIIEKREKLWQADLIFDIDYIFKWVAPVAPQTYFSFWVAPCTLIFQDAFDVDISINMRRISLDSFEIADLNLISKVEGKGGVTDYEWQIDLQQGDICFKSAGFEQIVRKPPIYAGSQSLTLDGRGGISFSKQPFE